mgnify:CR=1 FL=1
MGRRLLEGGNETREIDMTNTEYVKSEMEIGYHLIPAHMRDAVERYVLNGTPPGSFLTCILENDFMGAAARADSENRSALFNWALFLTNHVPSACKGSTARVGDWMAAGGVEQRVT